MFRLTPLRSSLFCLLILVGAYLPPQLTAATTDPIGYTAQRIAGTRGQFDRARTYLATPMLGSAIETGVIDRIDGTTLHLQLSEASIEATGGKPLQRGTYADTHYLQISKGPRAGYHVALAGGGAHTLQLSQDLSALLQPGDAYQVRPYATLGSVLGPKNQAAALHTAPTFGQADQIFIPDPQSGRLAAYYFQQRADGPVTLAHSNGSPSESDPILYPGSGFMISRIAEKDAYFNHVGDVQTHAAVIPVETGLNFVAFTFPVDTTLAKFFGPQSGGLSEEDSVILPREFGAQDQYRIRHTPDGPRWLPEGDAPPADQAKVPVGSVVILNRQGEPFNLRLERPFELEL